MNIVIFILVIFILQASVRNRTGEKRPPKEEASAKRAQKRAEFRRAQNAAVLPPAETFFKPLQSWVQLQERWKPIRIKALEDLFTLAESPLFPPAYDIVYSLPAPLSLHDALQKCSISIEHHVRGSVSPAVPKSRAKVLADFYFDADTHARAVSGYDWDSDAESSEMLSEKLQMHILLDEGEKAEVEMQCKILEDIQMQRTLDESLQEYETLDESLRDETLDEWQPWGSAWDWGAGCGLD